MPTKVSPYPKGALSELSSGGDKNDQGSIGFTSVSADLTQGLRKLKYPSLKQVGLVLVLYIKRSPGGEAEILDEIIFMN